LFRASKGKCQSSLHLGLFLSRATIMFVRHCFIASNESATFSILVSHSRSSERPDRKMRPASFSRILNCEGFFFAPFCEHARHCGKEGGNCTVVHSLLQVGHCLLITVANALHHHPFLWVLLFGHMSSRSRSRS